MKYSVIIIGLSILVFLLWRFDAEAVLKILVNSDLATLLIAFSLNFATVFLKTLRWKKLLLSNGMNYPLWQASLAYWSGVFLGVVTPGRVGELYRIRPVCRWCNVQGVRVLPSVVVDRLWDLYFLAVFAVAALGVTGVGGAAPFWFAAAVMMVTVGVAVFSSTSFAKLISRVGKVGWYTQVRTGFKEATRSAPAFLIAMTVSAYIVIFLQCILTAQALGLSLSPWHIVLAVIAGNIAAMAPISVSGLGTREAAILMVLIPLGVPGPNALGFSLALFIVLNIGAGIIGGFALFLLRDGRA